MTVMQCAALLGKNAQFVRIGLQMGRLPLGFAVKTSSKWSYYICDKQFEEVTGIKVPEAYKRPSDEVLVDVCQVMNQDKREVYYG